MSTTAQNLERLRQGVIAYALGTLGATAQQLSLHNVSFPEILTTLAVANSSTTCPDCGEPLRKHRPSMKALERLAELAKDHSSYCNENLLAAAREIRKLGGTTEEIQQFVGEHIDCADNEPTDCADSLAQEHSATSVIQ
jgi:hypothetical protein